MKYQVSTLFFLIALHWAGVCVAQATLDHGKNDKAFATATWVESSQDKFQVFESSCYELVGPNKTPHWTNATVIHSSTRPITSTSLVTLLNDTQILFWSEQNRSKTLIRYKSRKSIEEEWSKPLTLHDQGTENIGINLFRKDNKVWAFWAATDPKGVKNSLPDIIYREFGNGLWGPAKPVHANNNVPDIQPTSALNSDGDLVVEWLSYSFLQSTYIRAQKKISNGFDINGLVDIINVDGFENPDFLPSGQAITLRFPQNHFTQSRIVATAIQRPF